MPLDSLARLAYCLKDYTGTTSCSVHVPFAVIILIYELESELESPKLGCAFLPCGLGFWSTGPCSEMAYNWWVYKDYRLESHTKGLWL